MIRMNELEFQNIMQRIYATFGDKTYSKPRVEMIFAKARRIPPANFSKIVDHFLTTLRNAPMPIDFQNAVYGEMRANGWFEDDDIRGPEILCHECNDVGVIWVRYHDESVHSLMKCTCYEGLTDHTNLPTWDNGLRGVFKKSPLPSSWFPRPDILNIKPIGSEEESEIWKAAKVWMKKIRTAEKYWDDQRKKVGGA
jgi:hypothetical protein